MTMIYIWGLSADRGQTFLLKLGSVLSGIVAGLPHRIVGNVDYDFPQSRLDFGSKEYIRIEVRSERDLSLEKEELKEKLKVEAEKFIPNAASIDVAFL